eukprot:CAMPEP_0202758868 /NCGR_PEP_ID=MMETSP1388-20130828/17339_1 /ASSEMBLY_ACC=CAM_ASM_000864 /TAXON_ID=37098 /ORGANISM="Isochrysis sp, Strain CCMP1244" /LENGTH=64 /DNA_ID=CAMNT_0049426835 /DNA_START=93 /DNA_END=284 /DNA_ORIENTATION=+
MAHLEEFSLQKHKNDSLSVDSGTTMRSARSRRHSPARGHTATSAPGAAPAEAGAARLAAVSAAT